MEMLDRLQEDFFRWIEGRVTEKVIGAIAMFCVMSFFAFLFITYLIFIPLRWLWVHRLREGVSEVLSADRLKEGIR